MLAFFLPIALAIGGVVALALLVEPGRPVRAQAAGHVARPGGSTLLPGVVLTEPVTSTTAMTVCLPLVARQNQSVVNFWHATYFGNLDLANPMMGRIETYIDYDWGTSAPAAGLPADGFSVRWTGTWHFDAGPYTFFVLADDGVRLWVDNELILDKWYEGQSRHYVTWAPRQSGYYAVRLEYFDVTGSAVMRLRWRRKDLYPRWTGQYYDNATLAGTAAYSRTLDALQFDWADGCPSGLPCDNFGASFSAAPFFEKGTTRLSVFADDAYQLLIDGVPMGGSGWHEAEGDVYYDIEALDLEQHSIVFQVRDQGGPAEARLLRTFMEQPRWTAEYYPNVSLQGVPEVTRVEDAIFYDWGTGKPRPSVSVSDYFSVRWTSSRHFRSGFYRFGFYADDGVRLWVDGVLVLNVWRPQSGVNYAPVQFLQTGFHDVVVEYFDNTGPAEIRMWWE